jgi:hypothetical protein
MISTGRIKGLRFLPILVLAGHFSVLGYGQTLPCVDENKLDNTLIQAAGSAPIYLLHGGQKYGIQTPNWIKKNGYKWEEVHVLNPDEVSAIPPGYELTEDSRIPGTPAALEDKLISAPDSRLYLVKDGQRHWILDGHWITSSRYSGQSALRLSNTEIQALEEGPNITYATVGQTILLYLLTAVLCLFFSLASGRPNWVRVLWSPVMKWREQNRFMLRIRTRHVRIVLLGVFVAAIILRAPFLLLHPRFWAEEGTGWFQYASSHSAIQTLFFVHPDSGYLNLLANLAAVFSSLAARISLAIAPAATTLTALLIQVLLIAIILFGKSRLFDSLWKSVAGCLIILFAPTATSEIWLNTINSMSYLGAIALVLLFLDTSTSPSWARWAWRGVLVLCGLSSPYAVALLPLFVLSAWRDKDAEKRIHALILLCCSIVEVTFVVWSKLAGVRTFAMRGTQVLWDASMVNVFGGQIVGPAIGYPGQQEFLGLSGLYGAWTSASVFPHQHMSSLLLGGWACLMLIAAILWCLRGKSTYSISNLLLAAFIILATLTCVTSLQAIPLGRYAFMPGLAFLLLLWVNTNYSQSRITPYVCSVFLSYGLANGIMDYKQRPDPGAKDWASEVRIWRTDHAHKLRIWPSFWQESITYNAASAGVSLALERPQADTLSSLFAVSDIAQIADRNTDGAVDSVNSVTSPYPDNRTAPVQVKIKDSVMIQGWLVSGPAKTGTAFEEIYAVINGKVVKADITDRSDVGAYFDNKKIKMSGYRVQLGATQLHDGLQAVDLVGVDNSRHIVSRSRTSTFINAVR